MSPSHPPYTMPLGGHKAWADLPEQCGCFPQAFYFTFESIYMSMTLSHFVTAYTSPSPCPQLHCLYLCLYSYPVLRFVRNIYIYIYFRFHIYVLAYGICFSLSDLLHSVWQILRSSTSLWITQFRFFLWLSNIPLYICATSLSIHLAMDIFKK